MVTFEMQSKLELITETSEEYNSSTAKKKDISWRQSYLLERIDFVFKEKQALQLLKENLKLARQELIKEIRLE